MAAEAPDMGPGEGSKRVLHINRMVPNILTLAALAAGLTSVRYALAERWEHAVLAILVAAVLDALDGRVARMLKGATKFGAELDSLSDFVSFGVAPALVLYLWAMPEASRLGWIACMLFSMCCGLRLARFNVMSGAANRPHWASLFFTGVPAPAGAGLVLTPVIAAFVGGEAFFRHPVVVGLFLLGIGALFVSPIPTYSFKTVRVPRRLMLVAMLAVAVAAAFLVSEPWWTLLALAIAYVATFPFSVRAYRRLASREQAQA